MFLKTNLVTLLLLLVPMVGFGQGRAVGQFDVLPSHSAPKNYIRNPSAISNLLGTSTSSATLVRDTDAADRLDGISSFLCDSSSNGGECIFATTAIQEGDKTGNCEARATIKGDANLYSLRVTDGGTVLISVPLQSVSDWTEVGPINVPCGNNRDVRLVQTTAGTAPAVNIGRVSWGKATNIGTVAQAEARLSVYRSTSDQVVSSTAYTKVQFNSELWDNYAEYDPATNFRVTPKKPAVYRFTARLLLNGLTSGERYSVSVVRNGNTGVSSDFICFNTFTAGTATNLGVECNGEVIVTNLADFFEVFVKSDADTSYNVTVSQSGTAFLASVLPLSSEIAIRPNNSADLLGTIFYTPSAQCPANSIAVNGATLDSNIHAALIAKRTADGIASPSVLENLSGIFIRTAGTQTQGGVAHTAAALRTFQGDQMQGHFHSKSETAHTHGISSQASLGYAGGASTVAFQQGGATYQSQGATSNVTITAPTTDGTNGTPRTGTTTRPANMAMTACMWFVSSPAPLLTGSVTSNSLGAERVERATITCSGTPAVDTQSGSWVSSIAQNATGDCTLTIASGTFSGPPTCQCTVRNSGSYLCSIHTSPTATTLRIIGFLSSTAVANNLSHHIQCQGPR